MPKFNPSSNHQFKAVGAYVFAGGFTVGMSKHFDVLAHLEDGRFGVSTFSQNFPSVPVIQKRDWMTCPECDVIYGNPPCSGWSVMGSFTDGHKWSETKDWRRAKTDCSVTMFGLWRDIRPKIWVMESVTQIATKGRSFVNQVAVEAAHEGYSTCLVYHDPKFMGVPQTRRRVFIIVSRIELEFELEWNGMTVVGDRLNGIKPSAELPIVDPDLYWYHEAKPGQDFIRAWETNGSDPDLKPKHRTAHRVDPCTPLGTIHSDGHFGHPTEPRYLSASELSLLSGFPLSYKWSGSEQRTKAEISKGITPAAGGWLGYNLQRSLMRNEPVLTTNVTILNFMSRSPRRECDIMVGSESQYTIEEFTADAKA